MIGWGRGSTVRRVLNVHLGSAHLKTWYPRGFGFRPRGSAERSLFKNTKGIYVTHIYNMYSLISKLRRTLYIE